MLKKLTCALLALALLAPCLIAASAAAVPNYLIPFMFYTSYNNALETVIGNGLSSSSSSERQQYIDNLKISFTENIESIMYYNNSDWSLETSFYFSSGKPSVGGTASTLNFVINVADTDSRAMAQDAFVLAMCSLDSSIDQSALFDWARTTHSVNDGFDLGDYQIIQLNTDSYMHYAVLSRDSSASDLPDSSSASSTATGLPYTLAEYDGYVVTLTSLRLNDYDEAHVSLRFNISVTNPNGYKINLFANDAVLNGQSCKMWGSMYTEDNPGNYDDFLFIDSEKDSGYDAAFANELRNARSVRFTLSAQDDTTYKTLFEKDVTLDLSQLPIEGLTGSSSAPSASISLPYTLAEYDSYAVILKSLSLMEYAQNDVSLRLNISVVNPNGYKINLFVNDTVLNGLSCKMWGSMYSEDNPNSYDDFIFINNDDDTSIAAALRNARTLSFTLCGKDNDNYKVLFEKDVTLDVSQLPISVQ